MPAPAPLILPVFPVRTPGQAVTHTSSLRSVQVGRKRVPTAPCTHRTLLSHARGGSDASDLKAFALRLSLCTEIHTYTHTDCIYVYVYTLYTISEARRHINCVAGWLQAVAVW